MIACVLVPEFAATLERRERPALEKQPLLIAYRQQRVYAASREATEAGVEPGMHLRHARALCPRGILTPARPLYYQQNYDWLVDNLAVLLPDVEPGRGHQRALCYVSLDGIAARHLRPTVQEVGRTVRQAAGFEARLGVATGKFAALAAASAVAPGRARFVAPCREAEAVGALPIGVLALDGQTARQMRLLGIRTLAQFAALDLRAVVTQFGARGKRWHQLARGQDCHPVRPRLSTPHEQVARYFQAPLITRESLEAILSEMSTEMAGRLTARRQATTALWLVIRHEDGTRQERRWLFSAPTVDVKAFTTALLARSRQCRFHCGIEWLEIIAADLVTVSRAARQLDLFVTTDSQAQYFREALPNLTRRYGACFYRASPREPGAPLPERRYELRSVA